MKGVFYSVLLQIQGNVGDSGEDFGAPPRNDAPGFSIHRVRYYSACITQSVRLASSNTIYQYDDHLLWRGFVCAAHLFSPPLSQRFSPLSSACCSALTCLFSSIISHTSQSWSNYSRLCGYIWFLFACRGDRHRAMWMDALWSAVTLASQVFDITFLTFFCHRLGLRRLCAHALCLHPKQSTMSGVNGPISFQRCIVFLRIPVKLTWKIKNSSFLCSSDIVFIFNCCAPTMPRSHRAVNRRRWTIHWTTSAGWSAWWCSGLLCMEITCRRRMSWWPS